MHVLPGTGHLSPLEAPAEVARLIAQFVAAIEDTSPARNVPEQLPGNLDKVD